MGEYDVIVVGGGPAGLAAAVSAAGNGADVLLIERYGVLGGTLTMAGSKPFNSFFNMRGEQVSGGIAQEIHDRLMKVGGASGHLMNAYGAYYSVETYDIEAFKFMALEMVEEAGVQLLLHSFVTNAIVRDDKIRGVVIQNKSGRQLVLGKIIIDATGDGDVAARAGAPYEKGRREDGLMQAMSLGITMGNVDLNKILQYVKDNPEQFVLAEDPYIGKTKEEAAAELKDISEIPMIFGFFNEVREGVEKGEMHPYSPRGAITIVILPRKNEVLVGATRVIKVDGTDVRDLTRAELEGRKQAMMTAKFLQKYIPGFESSHLLNTASQIGVRETRRIMGEYILTQEDVLEGRKFDDVIGKSAYPIDIHASAPGEHIHRWVREGCSYDIPYRCLVPKEIDNLLVAGRCISTTPEAFASTRVAVTCMVTGQAAGTAAALAVREGLAPRQIDVRKLQKLLVEQGAILYGTY